MVDNQSNHQDTQNFDIDIQLIYNDFIGAIDKIRSYSNNSTISDQAAKNIFGSGDLTLAQLKSQITTQTT